MTFEEIYELPAGAVLDQWDQEGIQCLILRGPAAICAYLGIPKNHPSAGMHYDNVRLDVHGGLTFGQEGKIGTAWAEDCYWLGWDYAHCGDKSFYDLQYNWGHKEQSHPWTLEEVRPQVVDACDKLQALLKKEAWLSVQEALRPLDSE